MQKIKQIIISNKVYLAISLVVFLILVIPAFSLAQTPPTPAPTGLVPCDNSAAHPCDFNALLDLVNNFIRFVLFDMALPIAAIMFAYAGFLLITAGGEAAHARQKAKSIFTNAIIGLIIAAGAFLIIRTILSILGYQGSWLGFNPF